jgi:hypothetical protein
MSTMEEEGHGAVSSIASEKAPGTSTSERVEELVGGAPLLEAPLAVTPDGTMLLNITEIADRDLRGRQFFIGVTLLEEERADARRRVRDTCHEICGHLGGQMPKRDANESAPEGG